MTSVTKWGSFWKFLAANFISKVAQIFNVYLGYFEQHHFLNLIAVITLDWSCPNDNRSTIIVFLGNVFLETDVDNTII